MRLEYKRLRMDLHVLVLNGELRAIHFNFLVSRILQDDRVGDTLTDGAREFNCLYLWILLNSHLECVEEILT